MGCLFSATLAFNGNQNIDVVKGITTALVCWDKSAIDWDFLEWFLGQVRYHKIPEWVMPTAQAALAAQCDAKTVQPSQIVNMYPNAEITKNTFGLHLLGSYREKWLSNLENIIIPTMKILFVPNSNHARFRAQLVSVYDKLRGG